MVTLMPPRWNEATIQAFILFKLTKTKDSEDPKEDSRNATWMQEIIEPLLRDYVVFKERFVQG